MEKLYQRNYESPVGRIVLVGGPSGLRGAWFEGQKYFMRGVPEEMRTRAEGEAARLSLKLTALQLEPASPQACSQLENTIVQRNPWSECKVLQQAEEWLEQYFAGDVPTVQVRLDPQGTEFQKLVWRLLLQIPYGQTVTYRDLARQVAVQLGRTAMSAQAVGGAVGHNPISLFVSCHRVLGSDGGLTGYAGGIERKQWLLQHEQSCSKRKGYGQETIPHLVTR